MENETLDTNTILTEAVKGFITQNQAAFDEHAKVYLPRLWESGRTSKLEFQPATKYIKVWVHRGGVRESIHAFIDKTTGDIFMPAGLNKPAKHARGNVFAADNGASAFVAGCGSIRYLK